MRGEVPEGEHVVPLGKARVAREGTDVTLVAYGAMVPLCEQAADALDGEASVEVLDIRTLKPLDEEALLASAAKTGRVVIVQEAPRTAGYGAELAAILAEKAILDLRGPVLRVTGYDVPYPYWQIEDAYMPSVERVSRRCASCSSSSATRTLGLARPRRAAAWRSPTSTLDGASPEGARDADRSRVRAPRTSSSLGVCGRRRRRAEPGHRVSRTERTSRPRRLAAPQARCPAGGLDTAKDSS